jgi:hypothetical protein
LFEVGNEIYSEDEIVIKKTSFVKWGLTKISPVRFSEPVMIPADTNIVITCYVTKDEDEDNDEGGELELIRGFHGEDSYYADEVESEKANEQNYNEDIQPEKFFTFHGIKSEEFDDENICNNMHLIGQLPALIYALP